MGDERFLDAPLHHQAGSLPPVRCAGEDLRLGGIGFQIGDVGKILLFPVPVVVHHLFSGGIWNPEIALHIQRNLAPLRQDLDNVVLIVALHQSRQLIDLRRDAFRQLRHSDGTALCQRSGAPALVLVIQELIADGGGLGIGSQPINVLCVDRQDIWDHFLAGRGFDQNAYVVAAGQGGIGGIDHSAADGEFSFPGGVQDLVDAQMPNDNSF